MAEKGRYQKPWMRTPLCVIIHNEHAQRARTTYARTYVQHICGLCNCFNVDFGRHSNLCAAVAGHMHSLGLLRWTGIFVVYLFQFCIMHVSGTVHNAHICIVHRNMNFWYFLFAIPLAILPSKITHATKNVEKIFHLIKFIYSPSNWWDAWRFTAIYSLDAAIIMLCVND